MPTPAFTPAHKTLQKMLIDARKRAGLTQAQLAEELGKSQSFVAKCENGERRIDVIELLEWARVLNCDPANLVRRLAKALRG